MTIVIPLQSELIQHEPFEIVISENRDIPNPDFTKGETIPEGASHDWTLGATGARGWMYSEKLETSKARQIRITEVAEGSPAEGILQVGDVILGIEDNMFSSDPRVAFGNALTAAESIEGGGKLELLRWREGKTETVTVELPVLGDYSDTTPYRCYKSARIFERGCQALAERMGAPDYRPNPISRSLNALALLASGDEAWMPLIQREVEWASNYSVKRFSVWYYGYVITFLAEYAMQTGDASVLPSLRRLATESAEGQSIVGSWGHRFAGDDGRLVGYGMMNAPGVPLTVALELARMAGVILDDGRGWTNADRHSFYDQLSTEVLLKRLGSWSPVVRERAAMALSRREVAPVDRLTKMLDAPDRETRLGACQALKQLTKKPPRQCPSCAQHFGQTTFGCGSKPPMRSPQLASPPNQPPPHLLKMLAREPGPEDPRAMEQRYLSYALFSERSGLLSDSLEGVDRELLKASVHAGLRNQDGRARMALFTVF